MKTPKPVPIYSSGAPSDTTFTMGIGNYAPPPNAELIITIPPKVVHIVITNNLAVCATMMGKPRMDVQSGTHRIN